jgi:hypothetical protein
MVPVVYVIFGSIPLYLMVNVELASRNNPVVVLGDQAPNAQKTNIQIINARPFMSRAEAFSMRYVHMAGKDDSQQRKQHELQNFQRWFVLHDYMIKTRTPVVFFADGDSSVFGNMTEAQMDRSFCDAVLNVEVQLGNLHWVAAGESSFWTLDALEGFTDFVTAVYSKPAFVQVLSIKATSRPAVVDMSLLWLWWTRHKSSEDTSWVVGRPALINGVLSAEKSVPMSREKNIAAFLYAKSLVLPSAAKTLELCNGLDVVRRTVFDHMWGWKGNGDNFTLVTADGRPSISAAARTIHGGRSDLKADQVPTQLLLLNLHYQGSAEKSRCVADVCRVLLTTGSRQFTNPQVQAACSKFKY